MGNQEIAAAKRDQDTERAQAFFSGLPLVDDADQDPERMQAAGCDHETQCEGNGVRRFRQFCAVRVTVKYREHADDDTSDPEGGRTANATIAPRTIADKAMPTSFRESAR